MALCGNTQRRKRGGETGQLIVHKLPLCAKPLPRHERGKTHGSYGRCWALQVCSCAACARLAKPRLHSTHRHGGVQTQQLATQNGVVNCCCERVRNRSYRPASCYRCAEREREITDVARPALDQKMLTERALDWHASCSSSSSQLCRAYQQAVKSLSAPAGLAGWLKHCNLSLSGCTALCAPTCRNMLCLDPCHPVTNSTAFSTQGSDCIIIILNMIVLQYNTLIIIISDLRYKPYQGRQCRFGIHNDHCEIMHTQRSLLYLIIVGPQHKSEAMHGLMHSPRQCVGIAT